MSNERCPECDAELVRHHTKTMRFLHFACCSTYNRSINGRPITLRIRGMKCLERQRDEARRRMHEMTADHRREIKVLETASAVNERRWLSMVQGLVGRRPKDRREARRLLKAKILGVE